MVIQMKAMSNSYLIGFLLVLCMVSSCKKDCIDECRDRLNNFDEVENSSFEDWSAAELGLYEELNPVDQWVSLNALVTKPADVKRAPITVFRTTGSDSAYIGDGVMIKTGSFQPLAGTGNVAAEGILALGQLKDEGVSLENPIIHGQHFNKKIKSLTGYYKYFPEKNDSATIVLRGFNFLGCSCNEELIFEYSQTIKNTEEWTPFNFKVEEVYEGVPDGISLVFSSSGAYNDLKGNEGSTLFVDELSFKYND